MGQYWEQRKQKTTRARLPPTLLQCGPRPPTELLRPLLTSTALLASAGCDPESKGRRCDPRQVLGHSARLCPHICNTELTPPLLPPRAAVRTQETLCFSSDVTQGVRSHPHPQEQLVEKGVTSCLITSSAGTPCRPRLLPPSSPDLKSATPAPSFPHLSLSLEAPGPSPSSSSPE